MVGVLFPLYLLLVGAGYAALGCHGVMVAGNELSRARAFFLSVNAATLTGFQQSVGVGDFNPASAVGPAVVLILVLGGILFSLVVGGLASVRVLRLGYSDGQVVIAALTVVGAFSLAGAAVTVGHGRGPFDAVFHAVCALGNCGLTTGRPDGPTAWRVHAVYLPLAVLGGLGLPVLMDAHDAVRGRRRLCAHSRAVLGGSAIVYLAGFAILLFTFWRPAPHSEWSAWGAAVGASSAAAVNARTAGLPLPFDTLSRSGQWFLVLLMMIGASPAGTAGGLKITTLLQLVRGVGDALGGRPVTRAFGIAAVWFGAYLAIVAACFLSLLCTDPQMPADRLAFLSVSAASNVGLAHDPVSLARPGLYVLAGTMLAGRLAPLLVLWWLARTAPDTDLLVG